MEEGWSRREERWGVGMSFSEERQQWMEESSWMGGVVGRSGVEGFRKGDGDTGMAGVLEGGWSRCAR